MWNTQETGLSRGGGGETYGNFTFDKIEILGLHQVFEGDSERDAQKGEGEGEGGNPPLFSLSLYPHPTPPSTPATQATPTDTLGFLVSFYILVSH